MTQNRYKIIGLAAIAIVSILLVWSVWHANAERKKFTEKMDSKDLIIDSLNARTSELVQKIKKVNAGIPGDLLRIYTYDAVNDTYGIKFCLAVPAQFTLNDKLQLIIKMLRTYEFKKGAIELKRIEAKDGKQIAIIELRETKENPSYWKGGCFQGSCGGGATTYILTNTFLQRDYTGNWIDGVQFYYEGSPITDEWEHISLHGIKYRK